jgi:parallel beta-helix repeat protein
MRNSHIHHNIDGCRLGRSRFLFQHNLVENNSGKGINFRDSEVTLVDNIIRNNRAGIFLFEKPGKSVISRNNIYQNDINLQLGDFFAEDVALAGNWWGSADLTAVDQSIHDRQDDPELGHVDVAPVSAWIFSAGIQRNAQFNPLWRVATDGFVDAAPVELNNKIYFASWDGFIRSVDLDGNLLWKVDTGDVVDGSLLIDDKKIYLHNWGRQFYQLGPTDGNLNLLYEYPSSPSDDHRQAGLALTDQLILLPAWNGTLYAFDRSSMAQQWSFDAGMPLRAKPLVHVKTIYQGSGQNVLSALSYDGQLLWQKAFSGPLLSSPVLQADNIIVLDKNGLLSALKFDGTVVWQRNLNQTCFYSAPLVVQDKLFVVTAAGVVWKINPDTGQVIWSRQLEGSVYATPVSSDAGLLVGDNKGSLYLLDFDSGRILATHSVGGAIQSQVLVTGNRLYFGSRDQNLHAVQVVRKEVAGE